MPGESVSETLDLQSWMQTQTTAESARWFKLERLQPAFTDNMSALGFLEDLTNPIDERYILARWGGGTYAVISQAVGKGRSSRKNVGRMEFDLAGPPRAFPGKEGQPVLFPSAKAMDDANVVDDEDEEEEEEVEVRPRRTSRFGEHDPRARDEDPRNDPRNDPRMDPRWRGIPPNGNGRDFPYQDQQGGMGMGMNGMQPGFAAGLRSPLGRFQEVAQQRVESRAEQQAMKMATDASNIAQTTLANQLDEARKQNDEMRGQMMAREREQARPLHEAQAALLQQLEQQRTAYEAQLRTQRDNTEAQLRSQRSDFESQMRSQKEAAEARNLSIEKERDREHGMAAKDLAAERTQADRRVADEREAAARRVEEVKNLLTTQYETRLTVLTSERDQAARRAEEAERRAQADVERRVSEERRMAEQREMLVREMVGGNATTQVTVLSGERDRYRDEANLLRQQTSAQLSEQQKRFDEMRKDFENKLEEARKAADPRTSMANVASMVSSMKELGLAGGPPTAAETEEKIPDDMLGKIAAYGPKLAAAMEPILQRGAEARDAKMRLVENQQHLRMAQLAGMRQRQQQPAFQPQQQVFQQQQPQQQVFQGQPQQQPQQVFQGQPQQIVQPPAAQAEEASPLHGLLGRLQGAYAMSMSASDVAGIIKENAKKGEIPPEVLEAMLARDGNEVASELSEAAGSLGFNELATPRATQWLAELHSNLAEDEEVA